MKELKEMATKRVRFSEDVVDNENKSKPCLKAKKKPHYSRMRRNMSRYIHEENYEAMDLYLKSFSSQKLEGFYERHGVYLFIRALDSQTWLSVKALVESISVKNAIKILSDNKFAIIDTFLGGLSVGDEERPLTQETRTILIEKLKFLIDMGISANIEVLISENSYTSNIKKCFEIAKCQNQTDSRN